MNQECKSTITESPFPPSDDDNDDNDGVVVSSSTEELQAVVTNAGQCANDDIDTKEVRNK